MESPPLDPSTDAAPSPDATPSRAGRKTSAAAGRVGITVRKKKPGPKKGKYNAKGEHYDGFWFASQAELKRYKQLRELEAAGLIDTLRCQIPFRVALNNQHMFNYIADFEYRVLDELGREQRSVVEDVKGMVMPIYKLKRKMVEAMHGIKIIEIPAGEVDKWATRIP
ncbi:MAG: DUF1064 domain-containing protein [Novosphingobium sp.]|nr:DUF1064 domain-containing protein [Novosphingobium sp.]MCE2842352.1 DUF1064 domain-containing protein [Novosphingobium sp.]